MHSIWNGAIGFGLVNIPVKVYTAAENKEIGFHLLHKICKTPLKYLRHCPACKHEVAAEEIIKGYEYTKGQYVFFTEDELKNLTLPSLRIIEITGFLNFSEVDPIYFSRPYYLVPGEGGRKAYSLLHRTMVETNKIGLAKVTLRQRESLAALRTYKQVLLLQLMAYADEIRNPALIPELNYDPQLEPKELEMAALLVNSLSASFEPEKYRDRYRLALQELIEKKVAGQEIEVVPAPQPAKVVDLMEALKASIEQTKTQKRKPSTRARQKAGGA